MFSLLKHYPKYKLHVSKMQQNKCSVNDKNVNAENANAENVFYQAWSTTNVGVNPECHDRKEACALRVVVMLQLQVNQVIKEEYRIRHYRSLIHVHVGQIPHPWG